MYRSKRVIEMVRRYKEGTLTCDKEGNIYRDGIKVRDDSFDEDGYRHVWLGKYVIPFHKVIAYSKFGNEAIKKGIVTRHLNGNKLDNSWDNIAIGTTKDNVSDIPYEVKKNAATTRWLNISFEERRLRNLKGANNISVENKRNRSTKGALSMTPEVIKQAQLTKKLLVPLEDCQKIFELRDLFSMSYLSKVFDVPLSHINHIVKRESKYKDLAY